MQFQHKTYHFPVKQNHRLRLPCGRMGTYLLIQLFLSRIQQNFKECTTVSETKRDNNLKTE